MNGLIAWIDSHDRPEPTIDNGNGTLTIATMCVAADRRHFIEYETIPATMQAAREVLGY
ncbi:hypothetical protein [Paraburkholderia sp.]|uniref:hypothetical protein n=1 Tax=Paraburkholderia sp. TaxID=1926495 RepID=UPI00239C4EF9|nr:hypothetical protein [Paraburkholderia sp.]MDE1179462.1 hypothetical protein [Paraburkholderia sp.]